MESIRSGNNAGEISSRNTIGGKCGLALWFDLQQESKQLSPEQRQRLQSLTEEPIREKTRTVGQFTIFYDTTTANKPALIDSVYSQIPNTSEQYVDSVGKFFNQVWVYEIDSLGYLAPPLDPDGTYHVYISNLGFGYYGITWPENELPGASAAPRYTTYIEIDNDFSTVYNKTRGIPALKVTAAHEFHHAIQLGSYGSRVEDRYFYEITSTWMEDVVYTDVNDYYQYLSNNPAKSSQFSHPEIRFTEYNYDIEYSRVVWGKFIEKRFSRNVMKRTWEFMKAAGSIQSLDNALGEAGSSLKSAFQEYAYWNFLTGVNADTVNYYSEGKYYPSMATQLERTYYSPGISIMDSIQSLAAFYQPLRISGNQMFTIVTNVNTADAYGSALHPFVYSLNDNSSAGAKHLSNGLYVSMSVSDPENWSSQETVPSIVNEIVVYPNPFYSNRNTQLTFRLPQANQPTAQLSIFSTGFLLCFNGELPVTTPKPFEPVIIWNGHDNQNNTLSSGIYFYVLNVDGNESVGKFSVIRE